MNNNNTNKQTDNKKKRKLRTKEYTIKPGVRI